MLSKIKKHHSKIKKNLSDRFGIPYIIIIFVSFVSVLIFSLWATFFLYEPQPKNADDFNHPFYIFMVIFFPAISIIGTFVTTTKFIIDAILKKQGARLRLTIVLIIIALTAIPSIFITYVSVNIIQSNLEVTLHDSTENSLFTLIGYSQDKIEDKKEDMERTLLSISKRYLNQLVLSDKMLENDTYFTNIIIVSNIYISNTYERKVSNAMSTNDRKISNAMSTNDRKISNAMNTNDRKISNAMNTNDRKISNAMNTNTIIASKGIDATIDVRRHFITTNTVFVNSEYSNVFYITAIIPIIPYKEKIDSVSYYGIWTEAMPRNFIEERNDVLEAIRLYKSIDIFTNEYSTILVVMYIFMLGISLFFAIIFAIMLSSLITNPIGIIINASDTITSGNYDVNLKIRGMSDMRTLIHQFNIMARSLKHNKTLENKRARLETWREVSLTVAHEIKNPLTPIVMNSELIEKKVKASMSENEVQNIKSYSNIIKKNANIILNLVRSFSEYSFNSNMSENQLSINDVVKEAVAYFSNYEKIELNATLTKHDYMIKMDRDRLLMSITNVIKNSMEAIESKSFGYIYVSTYNEYIDKKEYFIITVTDTGIGMSEYDMNKIFEPYYTSKAKGTGLGLPLVERIISEHNGSITVESSEGDGATFFILFARNN